MQAIGELVRSEVRASEERMTARISESEERTKTSIMAYIENDVKKEIRQIADGHKMLAEKMDRMETKIDRLQDQVDKMCIRDRCYRGDGRLLQRGNDRGAAAVL